MGSIIRFYFTKADVGTAKCPISLNFQYGNTLVELVRFLMLSKVSLHKAKGSSLSLTKLMHSELVFYSYANNVSFRPMFDLLDIIIGFHTAVLLNAKC